MTTFPKVMAIGDAVEYLGVSRQYINKLVREGQLRCQTTSAGKIFLAEDIQKFGKKRIKKSKTDPRIKLK